MLTPREILSFFVSSTRTELELPLPANPALVRFPAAGPHGAERRHEDALRGASGNPLGIKTYYILCSSTESTLIIVAWVRGRKRFLMHKSDVPKALKNQRAITRCAIGAPAVHRFSTVLCTGVMLYAPGRRANEFAVARYADGAIGRSALWLVLAALLIAGVLARERSMPVVAEPATD